MPWADFVGFIAFNSISPIGDDRADYVSAFHTAALITTVRGMVNDDAQPADPRDLMPFRERSEDEDMFVPDSPEAERDGVIALFAGMRIVSAKQEG